MSKDIVIRQAPARILKGFAQVENVVALSQTLSFKAKGLYSSLSAFAMQNGKCYPDRETLAKLGQCHPNSVDKIVKELVAVGVITVKRQGLNKPNIYELNDVLTDEMIRKLNPYINPDSHHSVNPLKSTDSHHSVNQESHYSVNQDSHHSVREKEEKNNNKKNRKEQAPSSPPSEKEKKKEKDAEQVREVWDHWMETFKGKYKRATLTEKRKKVIRARLKDGFTVEDLKTAINAVSRSDWHIQNNYFYIENIFRNYERVEGWLNENEAPRTNNKPFEGQKNRAYVVADAAQTKELLDSLYN